jgi:hypothetical protein
MNMAGVRDEATTSTSSSANAAAVVVALVALVATVRGLLVEGFPPESVLGIAAFDTMVVGSLAALVLYLDHHLHTRGSKTILRGHGTRSLLLVIFGLMAIGGFLSGFSSSAGKSPARQAPYEKRLREIFDRIRRVDAHAFDGDSMGAAGYAQSADELSSSFELAKSVLENIEAEPGELSLHLRLIGVFGEVGSAYAHLGNLVTDPSVGMGPIDRARSAVEKARKRLLDVEAALKRRGYRLAFPNDEGL